MTYNFTLFKCRKYISDKLLIDELKALQAFSAGRQKWSVEAALGRGQHNLEGQLASRKEAMPYSMINTKKKPEAAGS